MSKPNIRLSRISALHYFKLIFRSLLLIAATVVYIINHLKDTPDPFGEYQNNTVLLSVIWAVFVLEMILRFFPSKAESMGCQKQFRKNFIPTACDTPQLQRRSVTVLAAVLWLLLNGILGALYYLKVIDGGILLLVALTFSVCDMICILFFCPFQTWLFQNKCCGTCRIYNWDYAMMFTPLVFIPNPFTLSLFGIAMILLITWEIFLYRHPERFSEATNGALSCANCKEKLCHHKKQLRHFLRTHADTLRLKGNAVIEKAKTKLSSKKNSDSKKDDTTSENGDINA